MLKINRFFQKIPNWVLYLIAPIPAIVLFYQAINGQLGLDPLNKLEDQYGQWALQLIIVGLCISPLRKFGINLIKQRQPIGLIAFFYVCAHLLVWLWFDQGWDIARIWIEIVKRPFITVGMVGFLIMIPLAITSNNRSIRKVGPKKWQKIHKLTYPLALLGGAHFMLVVKGWPLEPMIYLAIIIFLLAMRPLWLNRVK